MEPLKYLVYALRRYDLDRSQATYDFSAPGAIEKKDVVGFMSQKSKVYLVRVFSAFPVMPC